MYLFKFPIQNLTKKPLIQPHSNLSPNNISYTPINPKTSTKNTILFINYSPNIYQKSPTPPKSYKSPKSTPTIFKSNTKTTPHNPLPPLHNKTIFQSYINSTQNKIIIPII